MATVITFSGLVGTGKSVCSKYISSVLLEQKMPVYYLRYRFVSLKSFFEKKRQKTRFQFKENQSSKKPASATKRFENFTLKSNLIFAAAMFFYLWKAYLFFLLIKLRYSNDIIISDRYLYDSLVHYRIDQKKRPAIYKLFFKLSPKPDISFVLCADFETVMKARPSYDQNYIRINLENYRLLPELCPNTIIVDSNQIRKKLDIVLNQVNSYIKSKKQGG